MEMLCFEDEILPDKDGNFEKHVVLNTDRVDFRDVRHLVSIITELISKQNMTPLTDKLGLKPKDLPTKIST